MSNNFSSSSNNNGVVTWDRIPFRYVLIETIDFLRNLYLSLVVACSDFAYYLRIKLILHNIETTQN
jgi:hypothetical protein